MKRRPIGVSIIAWFYFLASAGYAALFFAWLFARSSLVSFVEEATPSASLGPALLLDVPGIVTTYFVVMSVFCCWTGVALWKLQRWAWFVTCAFVVLSFVVDAGLFAGILRHLPSALITLGAGRLAFLICVVAYLARRKVRSAFGLSRVRAPNV